VLKFWLTTVPLGIVAGLLVGIFGAPALIVATGVLALATILRSQHLGTIVAFAGLVPFTLYTLALIRCEPTFGRTCSLTDGAMVMILWPAGLAIGGAAVGYVSCRLASRRSAP
jgi:hypothetical protein